ncbi:BON domain-containing protein [Rappaport israeli]|uniref:BON domain-containing protein n=1 Tax=Rappaport israeli TaxID=1839807 RepID=UPI000931A696|nr:BON domain-containing protein [Rappaport israeli]
MQIHHSIALILSALFIQACAPLLIGGAATTAGVIHERRTAGTVIDDNTLEVLVFGKLSGDDLVSDNSHINVTAYNGQVLLSGEVFNEQIRARAVDIVQQIGYVKLIQNQLIIGRKSTLAERTYDTKQTAKVKIALLDVAVAGFDPTRVKVVTEHGITYLMGLVSEQEAKAATEIARRVSGVRKVITYFEIR